MIIVLQMIHFYVQGVQPFLLASTDLQYLNATNFELSLCICYALKSEPPQIKDPQSSDPSTYLEVEFFFFFIHLFYRLTNMVDGGQMCCRIR